MIPIIGVMIGLYIITRMVELLAGTAKTPIKVLAGVTGAASALGVAALVYSSAGLTERDPFSSALTSRGPFNDSTPARTAPVEAATWEVSESSNPIDDSPTVVLRLSALSGAARFGDAPILLLRCSRRETDAYVNWHDYMGSEESSITTRIDKTQAQTRRWGISTDGRATFYPGNPIPFIRSLMGADTLVVRATPYGESPITAVFAVRGLSDKVAPLQNACGWS